MSLRDELLASFPDLRRVEASASQGPWVVGGAVRDFLQGKRPADVDIACRNADACADSLGGRRIILGRGDVHAIRVLTAGHFYDFTELTGNDITADLERRDFTVNAMAVNLAGGDLIDPFGGEADLRSRLVRMVRPSNFDDDPLRLLKAVRMAVLHDLTIEEETAGAIRSRAERIGEAAPERVFYELTLILSAGALRGAVRLLRETRLAGPLGLQAVDVRSDDVTLAGALAVLVADPVVHARRWRWSTKLLRDVLSLRRLIAAHGPVALFEAGEEVATQLPAALRAVGAPDEVSFPDFSIQPLLRGEAIASLASVAGPDVGRAKRDLLHAQVVGAVRTLAEAEAFVRAWRRET